MRCIPYFCKQKIVQTFLLIKNTETWWNLWKFLWNAKDSYFENLLGKPGARGNEIWREMNKLLQRGSRQNEGLEIIIDNEAFKGQNLANKFNEYFTNLVDSIHDDTATSFLDMQITNSAFF